MRSARQRRERVCRVGTVLTVALVFCAIGCSAEQPIAMRDDISITNDVRAQFAADAQAGPLEITVDTKAGVVHLGGSVPNERDRNLVEQIARDTVGVREVDNDVMFGTSPPRRDP